MVHSYIIASSCIKSLWCFWSNSEFLMIKFIMFWVKARDAATGGATQSSWVGKWINGCRRILPLWVAKVPKVRSIYYLPAYFRRYLNRKEGEGLKIVFGRYFKALKTIRRLIIIIIWWDINSPKETFLINYLKEFHFIVPKNGMECKERKSFLY